MSSRCPRCAQSSSSAAWWAVFITCGILGLLLLNILWPGFRTTNPGFFENIFLVTLWTIPLIIPHELAHVLAALALRMRVFYVVIGSGTKLLEFRLLGAVIILRTWPMVGYVLIATASPVLHRTRQTIAIAAGPLVHLVLILVAISLFAPSDAPLFGFGQSRAAASQQSILGLAQVNPLGAFLFANLLACGLNLFPHRALIEGRRVPSDGLSLLTVPFWTTAQVAESRATYYVVQAHLLVETRHYQEANEAIERARQLADASDLVLLTSGLPAYMAGDFELARARWKECAARVSDTYFRVLLLNNVAVAELMRGPTGTDDTTWLKDAMEHIHLAWQIAPWLAHVRGTKGGILVAQGNVSEGIELLLDAWKEHTESRGKAICAAFLAWGYDKLENSAERDRWLAHAESAASDSLVLPVVRRFMERPTTAAGG